MQVTETLNEGLKRKLSVTIPKQRPEHPARRQARRGQGQGPAQGFPPRQGADGPPQEGLRPLGDGRSDAGSDQFDRLRHADRALRARRDPAQGRPAGRPDGHQPGARRRGRPRVRRQLRSPAAGRADGFQGHRATTSRWSRSTEADIDKEVHRVFRAEPRLRGQGRRGRRRAGRPARPLVQGHDRRRGFRGRLVRPRAPDRRLGRVHPGLRRAARRHEEGRDARRSTSPSPPTTARPNLAGKKAQFEVIDPPRRWPQGRRAQRRFRQDPRPREPRRPARRGEGADGRRRSPR